jgi:hypothetical protein
MVDQMRVKGGVLLGALVSGALAAGTLTGAPTANATCASFFGIGNSAQCRSNPTSIAIAIGTNAKAYADGLFGTAFSTGTQAEAVTGDAFSFATAVGDYAEAFATGVFGIAAQLGQNGTSRTVGSGQLGNIGANIAISVNPGDTGSFTTQAEGFGNIAANLFGNASGFNTHSVDAQGVVSIATNFGGNDSHVLAGGFGGNVAFNAFGSGNTVTAGTGPLAIAGSILQTGATIKKVGPGFNINGIVVGGAAAVRNARTAAPTATAVRTGKQTAAPAAAAHTPTKKPATSAAATSRGKR